MKHVSTHPLQLSAYLALLSIALIALGACSAQPDPIIDTKGVNMSVYEQDLEQCRTYAEQIPVAAGVAKSATAGAAVGGAVGAVRPNGNIGSSAAVGAILAGAGSGAKEVKNKENVVKRCLRYRGYRVLN